MNEEIKAIIGLFGEIQTKLIGFDQPKTNETIDAAKKAYINLFVSVGELKAKRNYWLGGLASSINSTQEALIKEHDELIARDQEEPGSVDALLKSNEALSRVALKQADAYRSLSAFVDWEREAAELIWIAAHVRLNEIASIMTKKSEVWENTKKEAIGKLKKTIIGFIPGVGELYDLVGWGKIIDSAVDTFQNVGGSEVRSDWTQLDRLKKLREDLEAWIPAVVGLEAFFKSVAEGFETLQSAAIEGNAADGGESSD